MMNKNPLQKRVNIEVSRSTSSVVEAVVAQTRDCGSRAF